MDDHLKRALEKQSRELAGASPIEQHIILLKLTELIENMPDLSLKPAPGASIQRQWIAGVGALARRISSEKKSEFDMTKTVLNINWLNGVDKLVGLALDAIEELKLDLELSGKADVGSAYSPGEVYKYFADLKSIIKDAKSEVFLIDPYFDGEAFNTYLADIPREITIRIFANKHASEVKSYIDKHQAQFGSIIEVRKSKKLHDRLVIIDRSDCWITGGSINHAGQKSPSYLIPIGTEISKDKLEIYEALWNESQPNA